MASELPDSVERRLDAATQCYYLYDGTTNTTLWDTPENRVELVRLCNDDDGLGAPRAATTDGEMESADTSEEDEDATERTPRARQSASAVAPWREMHVDIEAIAAPNADQGGLAARVQLPPAPAMSTPPLAAPVTTPSHGSHGSGKRYGTGTRLAFSETPDAEADPRRERLALAVLASHPLRLGFLDTNSKGRLRANLDSIQVAYGAEDDYEALLALLITSLSALARTTPRKDFALLLSHMLVSKDYLVESLVFPEAALASSVHEELTPPSRAPPLPHQPARSSPAVERVWHAPIAEPAAASDAPPSPMPSDETVERAADEPVDDAPSLAALNQDLDALLRSMQQQQMGSASTSHRADTETPKEQAPLEEPSAPRKQVPVATVRPSAACGTPRCVIS